MLRNQAGTAVKGRTAAATPASAGPKASPTARRAGSSGELPPPETSSVISVTLASTSATSSERGGTVARLELVEPGPASLPAVVPPEGPHQKRLGSETRTCWSASNSSTHLPAP